MDDIPSNLSTAALQHKYQQLREQADQHGQILTQKLASSQSGQNLLHIGSSLSTLPTDLHFILTQLHPVVQAIEEAESGISTKLRQLCEKSLVIRHQQRRSVHAQQCAEAYMDLLSGERIVKQGAISEKEKDATEVDEYAVPSENDDGMDEFLDRALTLERAALISLNLVSELKQSQDDVTAVIQEQPTHSINVSLPPDTERAQFFLQLAPRIRRLETDTIDCLGNEVERVLGEWVQDGADQESLMLRFGHAVRGLALTDRSGDVESIFARISIMPLIRQYISMGRLDQGGARGECAGLPTLLDDFTETMSKTFSPFLKLDYLLPAGIDLLTRGVWVPLATALLTDSGIRMAIFSPGISKILQTNYLALDKFLGELAPRLLSGQSAEEVTAAQQRIYVHVKTVEFSKKWNLPIYYQLRFGECSKRLNEAIATTTREGWVAQVFTGETPGATDKYELSLFLELHDSLCFLWRPDVILKPLTHRFLRGAAQMVGRVVAFIKDGMEGKIRFGEAPQLPTSETGGDNDVSERKVTDHTYCWGDSEDNVAAVAWELSVLENHLQSEYVELICQALGGSTELSELVSEYLTDAAKQISPVLDLAWNTIIVKILTQKCTTPLALVKGVAATYRMTNRPPPMQPSHFCDSILRPLQEFSTAHRTPPSLGLRWKQSIVVQVADQYASAVEDLLATVARTEVTLQRNRRAARMAAAVGMSDTDKVKLQLYLDYQHFVAQLEQVGINPATVVGLQKLEELTQEGKKLRQQ